LISSAGQIPNSTRQAAIRFIAFTAQGQFHTEDYYVAQKSSKERSDHNFDANSRPVQWLSVAVIAAALAAMVLFVTTP